VPRANSGDKAFARTNGVIITSVVAATRPMAALGWALADSSCGWRRPAPLVLRLFFATHFLAEYWNLCYRYCLPIRKYHIFYADTDALSEHSAAGSGPRRLFRCKSPGNVIARA
jgi:hypothetical protein